MHIQGTIQLTDIWIRFLVNIHWHSLPSPCSHFALGETFITYHWFHLKTWTGEATFFKIGFEIENVWWCFWEHAASLPDNLRVGCLKDAEGSDWQISISSNLCVCNFRNLNHPLKSEYFQLFPKFNEHFRAEAYQKLSSQNIIYCLVDWIILPQNTKTLLPGLLDVSPIAPMILNV